MGYCNETIDCVCLLIQFLNRYDEKYEIVFKVNIMRGHWIQAILSNGSITLNVLVLNFIL